MASIRPQGKGYECRFSIDGEAKSVTIQAKISKNSERAVGKQCEEAERRLDDGEPWDTVRDFLLGRDADNRRTLGFWAQHYLDVVAPELDGVADSTLMGYESCYHSHWSKFSHRRVKSLTVEELQKDLMPKDLSKKTKREALALLKRIMKVAGVHTLDEWEIRKSKKDAEPEPDPYEVDERDKLLSALQVEPIAHAYFTTAFYTGMRTGELLGLHWPDFDGGGFNVWRSMVRRKIQEHTKTKRRYVVLPDNVIRLLKNYPTRFTKGLIFQTPTGLMFKDADWLMKHWDEAHTTTGVRRRTGNYPWRHTFISLNLMGNVSINDVAVLSGNSRAVIEKHYAKWIRREEDVQRMRMQIEMAQRNESGKNLGSLQ